MTTTKIRELNDLLRIYNIGGMINITAGVQAQNSEIIDQLFAQIRSYHTFTPDNDPHKEHDFGSITLGGVKYFWKIDYYDPTFTRLSDNPADAKVTNRVMTVMLADEY